MSKKIELTKGKYTVVDDDDYPKVSLYKWYAVQDKGNWYAVRQPRKKGGPRRLHRFLMEPCEGQVVDHIDGDGLNNRRKNLRACTIRQNNQNRKPDKNTSSKFRGVSWKKERKKWVSYIQVRGKSIHLGYFSDENDAALTFDKAARLYFGEFAGCNFPQVGQGSE